MRVLFMGTPDFSVGTLEKLIESGHEVIGVFTQPDKPKGRGKAQQFTPVKEVALAHNIPVYQPSKVKEVSQIEFIGQLNPEVIVVVAFGQIISKDILDIPKYGCINVHASLLPKYRGAAPIQWAIINGEEVTGVTTMRMDEGIDTGDMILKEVIAMDKKETNSSLFDKLSTAGANLLIKTLQEIENGTATYEKQGETPTPYAKMIQKKMGLIDWSKSAEEIERLVRGLNPWPSAFTHFHQKTLKVWEADVVHEEMNGQNGEIIEVRKDALVVKTGKEALSIKELQLEGKKRMTVEAFLRGYEVCSGEIFGSVL